MPTLQLVGTYASSDGDRLNLIFILNEHYVLYLCRVCYIQVPILGVCVTMT